MKAEIYWVDGVRPGKLALLPRPRGGDWLEEEIQSLKLSGADVLVSLLTPEEVEELDIVAEPECCAAAGVEFISFPIMDREVPESIREARSLVRALVAHLGEERAVAIHCRQGIGRAGLISACVLVALGEKPQKALERVSRARGRAVPDTEEQAKWVRQFAGENEK